MFELVPHHKYCSLHATHDDSFRALVAEQWQGSMDTVSITAVWSAIITDLIGDPLQEAVDTLWDELEGLSEALVGGCMQRQTAGHVLAGHQKFLFQAQNDVLTALTART